MGVLDFFAKKRKAPELELPPPPPLEELQAKARLARAPQKLPSDIPPVRGRELPELPTPPKPEEMLPPPPAIELPKPVPDKTVPVPEMPEAPEAPHPPVAPEGELPMFVSVQDYKAILEGMTFIKNKIADTEKTSKRLTDLRQHGKKEFEAWRGIFEDIQRKLTYVDEVVFESQKR